MINLKEIVKNDYKLSYQIPEEIRDKKRLKNFFLAR